MTKALFEYCEKEATLEEVLNNPSLNWDYGGLAKNPRLTLEWLERIPQLSNHWACISWNKGPGVQAHDFLAVHWGKLDWYAVSISVSDPNLVDMNRDFPWDLKSLLFNENIPFQTIEIVFSRQAHQFSSASLAYVRKGILLRFHGQKCRPGLVNEDFDHFCGSKELKLKSVEEHKDHPWNFRRLSHHPRFTVQWALKHFPERFKCDGTDDFFDINHLSEIVPLSDIRKFFEIPWAFWVIAQNRSDALEFILEYPGYPWNYVMVNHNIHMCIGHARVRKENVWQWDLAVLATHHGGPECKLCLAAETL